MRKDALAWLLAPALIAVVVITLAPTASSAKTPDGMPPSQETVCSGLHGAAFGLCNAYCEAQDCDVHPRPSCAQLLKNFGKITGMSAFPCDSRCGNGTIDPNEDCDPPGSLCSGSRSRQCRDDCTCPVCGDGIIDPNEQCDPGSPVSICPCRADCTCETTVPGCCECEDDACVAEPATGCPDGCVTLPGLTCNPFTAQCEAPEPTCCDCGTAGCVDANSPDECPQSCTPVPNFSCNNSRDCVGFGPAP